MSYCDRGGLAKFCAKNLLNECICISIHGSSCLVQDHNLCSAQQRTSYHQQLSLTHREVDAPFGYCVLQSIQVSNGIRGHTAIATSARISCFGSRLFVEETDT